RQRLRHLGAHALPRKQQEPCAIGVAGRESRRGRQTFAIGGVKTQEARDRQIILRDPRLRVADEANPPCFNIVQSAGEIDYLPVAADEQRIDREIASPCVFLPLASETDRPLPPVGLHAQPSRRAPTPPPVRPDPPQAVPA